MVKGIKSPAEQQTELERLQNTNAQEVQGIMATVHAAFTNHDSAQANSSQGQHHLQQMQHKIEMAIQGSSEFHTTGKTSRTELDRRYRDIGMGLPAELSELACDIPERINESVTGRLGINAQNRARQV